MTNVGKLGNIRDYLSRPTYLDLVAVTFLCFQVTSFGEGVIGTALAGAAVVGYVNAWNPWGWGTLAVAAAGTYVKTGIDVAHSIECGPAGKAAQEDYADASNLWETR